MQEKIPKVIHYFWFGRGDMPDTFQMCYDSWKRYCPDYEIKLWNEDNFNILEFPYCKEAYEKKKYAFVSDYARFYTLEKYGGIYMDVDVELLKPIDRFLEHDIFMGFEDRGNINPGLMMGAKQNNKILQELIRIYNDFNCFPEKTHNICTITTEFLTDNYNLKQIDEIQNLDGIVIYPMRFFCACNLITKKMDITGDTYSVHHYNQSWLSNREKIINFIKKISFTVIGQDNYDKLKKKYHEKKN